MFSIECIHLQHGWLTVTVSDGLASRMITASDLGDAPYDFISAVNLLLAGVPESRCRWWEEPGEYRWLFSREDDIATIRILDFKELWSDERDENGELVFSCECKVARLANQTKRLFWKWLHEYGAEGYKDRWNLPFPMAEYEKLSALISGG